MRDNLHENASRSLPVGRFGEAQAVAQDYLFLMQSF
jgi:hypothetical protein